MGVPTLLNDRSPETMSGVEKLARQGDIDSKQQRFLAGNGMHLSAIGSVLTYALSITAMIAVVQEPVVIFETGNLGEEEGEGNCNTMAEAVLEQFPTSSKPQPVRTDAAELEAAGPKRARTG
eukprot:8826239-Lingulodinium_polyedra.AAC.1